MFLSCSVYYFFDFFINCRRRKTCNAGRTTIDRAIKLVEEQIEEGVLNQRMTIEEMIDALEIKKEKLIGDDTEEVDEGDNLNDTENG